MGRCRSGYSLVELLVTTAVISILLSAGLKLGSLVERNRRWEATSELMRLVQYARAEAVNGRQEITLCAIDELGRCARDWQHREVAVFRDENRNRRLDDGEARRLSFWPASRGRLRWRAALGRPYLEYSALGSTHQNGSFILCRTGGRGLAMRINRGGRPYLEEYADCP